MEEVDLEKYKRMIANEKRQKVYRQKWYVEHKDEYNEKRRKNYELNPEPRRKATLKWAAENPEKKKEYYERNKERILARNKEKYYASKQTE